MTDSLVLKQKIRGVTQLDGNQVTISLLSTYCSGILLYVFEAALI